MILDPIVYRFETAHRGLDRLRMSTRRISELDRIGHRIDRTARATRNLNRTGVLIPNWSEHQITERK